MNETEVYKKFVKPGDVVYDIGAYVGEMSKTFIANGAAQVYAFEPAKDNYNQLINNCAELPIAVFNVALHEKAYHAVTRFKDCSDGADKEQPIEYVILKDFISGKKLNSPDFIKMDIEGMEGIVLKTVQFLLETTRSIVYAEIHANPRTSTHQSYEDNPHFRYHDEGGFDFNILKTLGYRYFHLDSGNLHFRELSPEEDFNPVEGSFGGTLMLPKEIAF